MKRLSVLFLLLFCGQVLGQQVIGKHTGQNVARGKETNHTGIFVFGRNTDLDIGTEDIWAMGGTVTLGSIDTTVKVASGSANDKTSGTGALTVQVFGVDGDYARINETFSMNGTDSVTLVNEYRFIYKAVVLTAGTGLTNAAVIGFEKPGGVDVISIPSGKGQSASAYFPVADGETAYIYNWGVATELDSISVNAELVVLDVDNSVWNFVDALFIAPRGESSPHRDWSSLPFAISGPALVRISGTTDTNDTDILGYYTVIYN